jgi:F-type H+-transporting ATPase subunit gamma
MAAGKEIRNQIASVKNTQKITRAMEMVAASKMRKTKDRMTATRPYAQKAAQIIRHIAHSHSEYQHPFMVAREVRRIGLILVSSDRGLCGGLNSNLFRLALARLREWDKQGIEVDLGVIGQKGAAFFANAGARIIGQATHLGDAPHLQDIIGVIKLMTDSYEQGNIDALYLLSNTFVNTMTQRPVLEKMLPIKAEELDDSLKHHWDYIYEPDAKEVLDEMLQRYVEALVYQGVVENVACEQAARMVAMKSASDNAGKAIKELQLIYNKTRQAAITQELAEIVAGAAAV